MEWVTIAALVMQGISMIEKLFGEAKGAGAVKKETVTNMVTSSLTALQTVSTGGQLNTVNALIPVIGPLIDAGVALMNQTSQLTSGKDVIDCSPQVAAAMTDNNKG